MTTPDSPLRTVEDYLAAVPEEARASLEQLRRIIKETVPEARETISYRIPTFNYHGPLVALSVSKTALGKVQVGTVKESLRTPPNEPGPQGRP